MQTILITVLSIFMTTMTFGQQKNEHHSESHSIQIKYSITFEQEEFPEVCKIISSEYPEFDCASEKNSKIEIEDENEYLRISIKREKKIRMVLKTTDPENVNIKKFHELKKRLDKY